MRGPHTPWNKGRAQGQKRALTVAQVRRVKELLEEHGRIRDLALFSLALDTLLRASDLLALRVSDVRDAAGEIRSGVTIRQKKTGQPLTVELSTSTRVALAHLIHAEAKAAVDYLFAARRPSALPTPLSRRWYGHLVKDWAQLAGITDTAAFSTHSLRRTRAAYIYENTNNLEAVRRVLGHKSLASTSAYLGVDDSKALDVARKFQL